MRVIKELMREMPFGRTMMIGVGIYTAMLMIANVVIAMSRMGADIGAIVSPDRIPLQVITMFFVGIYMVAFVALIMIVPKVITLYPILGYFYIFVKDNRMVKILPLDNKQKFINLLKGWGKFVCIYCAIGLIEFIYLLIMFGSKFEIESKYIMEILTMSVNVLGISLVGTVIFTFSIIIAAVIQNIYKIDKWKVIVGYIVGYIVVSITERIIMIQTSRNLNFIYGIDSFSDITLGVSSIFVLSVAVVIGELYWLMKNINRLRAR